MLAGLKEVLMQATRDKRAIAAFNVPNLEMVKAAIQAAEELDVPVILQHAEGHNSLISLEEIGPIMMDYAKRSKVPVVVHLDHGKSLKAIITAIKIGFTSVMIDASDKPFEENILLTKEIVKIAHSSGVDVEAELGHVFTSSLGGGEGREPDDDLIGMNDDIYTDPELAKSFVEQTGVDCLAVAFGTVHGIYLKEPRLDLERVRQIQQKVEIPLVMHGGSGVSKEDYHVAISNGIAKINYYTYANQNGARAIRQAFEKDTKGEYFLENYLAEVTGALKEDYCKALKIFSE
ncbi:fructose-bisphosphate aldolase class II [Enterococcus sp. PF1-24]|uniref:class II fructose-bisphosphate aldolase n=1 Tax=unclassified Enterococcus TaxID=2608891 RepID=UPI002474E1F6|nr:MULTISPECIES: class II fructose-bisphosphate aldolase [unclassified Enterococcus]MDH6365408.1 fructose-bisphosphate aldolase class II [Enterococcus sp. PFB1-1]MDH6402520.1 fructose-bisphosphate aldolase class II [Enterococcus sp. PF1-24]